MSKAARNRRASLVAFALMLTFHAHAERMVSLNLCTDDFLVLLAPEKIVALSPLARDPALSVVADAARALPWVRADAEAVIALHPDLVLAGPFGAQTTIAALVARGLRVDRTELPQDFTGIRAETRRLATLLGAETKGDALLAAMDAKLAAVPRRPPEPALGLEARGYVAGPGSLEDAVLRAAGLTNAGLGGRLGLEAIAAHPPALLVVAQSPATPSLATDLLLHPVLRHIPRKTVNPALIACGGPWTADAVTQLTR